MNRAPGAVGLMLGICLAVAIALVGPLALFNPWFTSALQQRHAVAATLDTSQAEVDRVTGELLVDIYTDGAFDAAVESGEPILNARERSHMHDVAVLVRLLAGIAFVAVVFAVVAGIWLRHEPRRIGRVAFVAGTSVGTLALVLAIVFAIAFEPAFLAFHELFFPPGTYLFEPGSRLIALFPEGFWLDAALAAGASIIVVSLAFTLVGFRVWRGGRATPASA